MLSESSQIPSKDEIMFSLFLRPISPHDVRLYALRDEIEHSKRFYLSPGVFSPSVKFSIFALCNDGHKTL